ncbi:MULTISPECIES: head GIN domain-containing protein [unclassified Duganella]|uniref:head GIN domain-containing protein n=1 Tax=unclassified Duganella TaxID=2636909 RepID=UPI00087F6091|nr:MULTISPECIES: head GIN domain-containing protein [unclassified Duganella]SDG79875.1 Putative auto-transporter adhesin, head GIN domain [Duganella sp. OV458]SDK07036.1 Putative auto-transporter adhesin, head GIN domain [Duganella sp. OV510]
MRALMKIGAGLLVLAFALVGATYSMLKAYGSNSPTSTAGRTLSSETRKIDAMATVVELSGPIDLILTQGQSASLKVRGEQRSLANVETLQDGRDLHIGTKGMLLNPRHRLQVELVLPSLQELVVTSSGDTKVSGFNGEQMELQLHGSGNVNFSGRYRELNASAHGSGNLNLNAGSTEKVELVMVGSGQITASGSCKVLNAELTGSGDLNARHLAADSVTVNLRGSGTSHVFAKQSAELTLRGSGDIRVLGNPNQRNVNRTGSGEVSWE